MLSTADVPRRFADRTLDGYHPSTPSAQAALAAARRLTASGIRSLVLIGPTGVGKSHLAAGICNAISAGIAERFAIREGERADWITARNELQAEKPGVPPNDPATVEAERAWLAQAEAEARAKAAYGAAVAEHWQHRPDEPRPSEAWAAWDAEIPPLEAQMRAVRELAPAGMRPRPQPTTADMAAYHDRLREWQAREAVLSSHRPIPLREPEPEWENVAELILGLRLEMADPPDERHTTLRVSGLRHHPALLVLDDLGREKASDWTGEKIYTLVNARYEALLPTLVTSNLTAGELAASPYWPVISRLAEDGALVSIEAPDHRLGKPVSA